ncbi:MAG: adenylate/guanylate cyclase domain-containing protein [Leptospirales bacterium]
MEELTIGNCILQKKIFEGPIADVYEGIQETTGSSVIIKLLKQENPRQEDIAILKYEYAITREIKIPEVVKVISVEQHGNQWALVKENPGGKALNAWDFEADFTMLRKIELSLSLANITKKLHELGILHKDIKPSNLIFNYDRKELKVTDFGLSGFLTRETVNFSAFDRLGGSVYYISPEQTGRINRSVDFRSDLYSVGATLYELFCGKPPFVFDDPMQTIHSHIAKIPVPPHEVDSNIPLVISQVIIKLLEKNPEDRYQSAEGLEYDIEKILKNFESDKIDEPFEVGRHDTANIFMISQRLFGREKEIASLLAVYNEVIEGDPRLLLVTGLSGIGKTSLIHEIHQPLTLHNGYFVQGKYDQYKKDLPYAAVIESLRDLFLQLLLLNATEINEWKIKLLEALGSNGRIVVDVIPESEFILGDQPPVPELSSQETQNRFLLVFQNLIQVFSRPGKPLVMFFDDLQWADSASLKLIKSLMSSASQTGLMIIGAYRNNEVDQNHILMSTLHELAGLGIHPDYIEVGPLDKSGVNDLISNSIRCESSEAEQLAEIIIQKTNGNPFFVNEFFKSIHASGLIHFIADDYIWKIELEQIVASNVTDNVLDFITEKVNSLPKINQQTLSIAAVIGSTFNLATLASLIDREPVRVASYLKKVITEGMIIPKGDYYRFSDAGIDLGDESGGELNVEYVFAHDRIQQAAYSIMTPENQKKSHLKLARLYMKMYDDQKRSEYLFDIVNQYNHAKDLVSKEVEKYELIELNLAAAKKADSCNAFSACLQYCQTAISLLDSSDWKHHYESVFNLYRYAAQSSLYCADYSSMDEYTTILEKNSQANIDKVAAYEIRIEALIAQNLLFEAVQVAVAALNILGQKFPKKPGNLDVLKAIVRTHFILRKYPVEKLATIPEMKSPETLAAMRIMTGVFSAAYISLPPLMPIFVMRQVELSAKKGNSPLSAFAYANYGLILSGILGKLAKGYAFSDLALGILEKYDTRFIETKTIFSVYSFIKHLKLHPRETIPLLMEAYKTGLETGDFEYTSWSILGTTYTRFFCGDPLEPLLQDIAKYNEIISKLNQESVLSKLHLWHQVVLNFKSKSQTPWVLLGEHYNEEDMIPALKKSNQLAELAQLFISKLILAVHFKQYHTATMYADEMEKHLASVPGTMFTTLYFAYNCFSRIVYISENSTVQKKSNLNKVKKDFKKLQKLADFAGENLLHFTLLMDAEFARYQGKNSIAEELYKDAIKAAEKNNYIHIEAMICERLADFYKNNKSDKKSIEYQSIAKSKYETWGSDLLPEMISTLYKKEVSPKNVIATDNLPGDQQGLSTSTSTGFSSLDIQTVLKASEVISRSLLLDKLASDLLEISLENAGASRGFILIKNESGFKVFAGAEVKEDRIQLLAISEKQENSLADSIVQFCARTGEIVVVGNATTDKLFGRDTYIQSAGTKSVLCLPIKHFGEINAMLYLENNLIEQAFSENRLELLKLLSGQIAVSINNAMLYENLEEKVKTRTKEIEIEKKKSDDLLLNILPEETANELKKYGKARVKKYENASIMFIDFIDFTKISELMSPHELVYEIDTCFSKFDMIIESYGIEKIKTIGDAYMCASGLPVETDNHAQDIINAGLDIRDFLDSYMVSKKEKGETGFSARIGIHSGSVVAGVVGLKKFAYDIWGDTVNIASRIESSGEKGKVNVSATVRSLVPESFNYTSRGKIKAKNKGELDMYFVERQ